MYWLLVLGSTEQEDDALAGFEVNSDSESESKGFGLEDTGFAALDTGIFPEKMRSRATRAVAAGQVAAGAGLFLLPLDGRTGGKKLSVSFRVRTVAE